jgi:nucleotide-binding universal stress UspA family protein
VVYVSTTRDKGARRRHHPHMGLPQDELILKDIVSFASTYDVPVTTAIHSDVSPDVAIVAEARGVRSDLIVMGVDRIAGDTLNFGSVAAAVLRHSKVSVLLVSSGEARQPE